MIPFALEIDTGSLNLYNTIISGVIVTIVTVAIERLISYIKKEREVRIKTTYQLNEMTDDTTSLKTELNDTIKKTNENIANIKETIGKLDSMSKEVTETRKAYRRLVNILNKHESEIRTIAKKTDVDISAFSDRDFTFKEEDSDL